MGEVTHDGRVGNLRQHQCFLLETQGLRALRLGHHLKRDILAGLQILGPIHQAHAALDRLTLDAKTIAVGLGMGLRTHSLDITGIRRGRHLCGGGRPYLGRDHMKIEPSSAPE